MGVWQPNEYWVKVLQHEQNLGNWIGNIMEITRAKRLPNPPNKPTTGNVDIFKHVPQLAIRSKGSKLVKCLVRLTEHKKRKHNILFLTHFFTLIKVVSNTSGDSSLSSIPFILFIYQDWLELCFLILWIPISFPLWVDVHTHIQGSSYVFKLYYKT